MKSTRLLFSTAAALTTALALGAQQPASALPGGEQVIVTALGHKDAAVSSISATQVEVQAGHDRPAVASWQFCSGNQARLDLVIALDEDSQNIGTRLSDIKDFVNQLPPSTAVGIVYFHTGTVQIAQAFTENHARAVAALREPSGAEGSSPSPYGSLEALLAKWPQHPGRRREMVLFSDGTEHLGGSDSNNSTFQQALAQTVAGGIVVYGVFVSGATSSGSKTRGSTASDMPAAQEQATLNQLEGDSDSGDSFDSRSSGGKMLGGPGASMGAPMVAASGNNGLINLSMLAEATGGQAYSQGDATPTRFTPYLDEVAARLQSQYVLSFAANPERDHGLIELKVDIKDPGANITAPKQVYVGGSN